MKTIISALGRFVYFLMGWTYEDLPDYFPDRCVVIGFPHTSNMDTVRALTYIKIARVPAKLLVKAGWFFFPMSLILKNLGGIPVKRDKAHGFVESAAELFRENEELVLALVPEGTRKKVSRIKTGFWHIAKSANVPIVCWYLDNNTKKTRWLGMIHPGLDLNSDLIRIHRLYEKAGHCIPLGDLADIK